ncbi:DNA-protecting protein DprA [Candidatus Falkowbacteria bacterium CG10_big_fil_rev_8_21_14_0_10_43_10]|uniref:DNA-protecting protein DprA n=1 Tax=Candidatus Falkowbacteria bacterium CG10_big_fil_rev_8_21_14_0_10_43_10 TaxID=1974567 RepID=A0A2H0V1Y6_9BACT|nr:MAG: DNA-protecting protein DprA [Candidatus Falkowbacteria bacterium CG10_big_fil_rev_8_21_14_0_10_43_10]
MSITSNAGQDDVKYWIALSTFNKFGPVRFSRLQQYFTGMEAAWKAPAGELIKAGLDQKTAAEFAAHRQKTNPDEELEKIERENIKTVTIGSKLYPKLLKEIYDPPFLLYYKGAWPENTNFCLAVVGSRKYSSYGRQTTEYLVSRLAQSNLIIVSGLALGIDALAHLACVKSQGTTIAVLGSGLDKKNIYPAANRYVAEQILNNGGLIITEYPCGTPPFHYNFPQRNRIISGLSLGVLIIEASLKSGTSITAKLALEQGREVFAVPGNIFSPNSEGTNKLIKEGARPISSAEEILEALSLKNVRRLIQSQKIIPETPAEEKIIGALTREPAHINQIARNSQLDTGTVNATLLTMELKGTVRNLGGGNYVLS